MLGTRFLVYIKHATQNVSIGISHLTFVTELIATAGLSSLGQEILQLKNPLNWRAIEQITRVDGGGDGGGVGASGEISSQQAKPGKTRETVVDLA